MLHGEQLRQESRALRVVPEAVDHPGHHVVDGDVGRDGRAALRERLEDQRRLHAAEPGSAALLAHVDAGHAERRGLADDVHREMALLVPFERMGRKLLGREVPRHVADGDLVVGEGVAHAGCLACGGRFAKASRRTRCACAALPLRQPLRIRLHPRARRGRGRPAPSPAPSCAPSRGAAGRRRGRPCSPRRRGRRPPARRAAPPARPPASRRPCGWSRCARAIGIQRFVEEDRHAAHHHEGREPEAAEVGIGRRHALSCSSQTFRNRSIGHRATNGE